MARNINCKCEHNFTCGYCLMNAKPYFFTMSSGERTYQLPAFLSQPSKLHRDAEACSSNRGQHPSVVPDRQ